MQSIYSSTQNKSALNNSTENETLVQTHQPSELAPVLVVIDPKVSDYQMLAESVLAQANVMILDQEKDGVEQITEALANYPTSALHIVSHGSPGRLQLGNTYLSLENIDSYAWELKTWSNFLGSSPVLLYGCQVAAGQVGQNFLARLHELINTEIAASANLTGSREMDGDWELEVTTGSIEVPLAFPEDVREAYTSVLLDLTIPIPLLYEGVLEPFQLDLGLIVGPLRNAVPDALNLPLGNVTITLDPDAQLDLGNGADQPLSVDITDNTDLTQLQSVPVLAVDDQTDEQDPHPGTITVTVAGAGLDALETAAAVAIATPELQQAVALLTESTITAQINDPLPELSITTFDPNLPIVEGNTTSLTVALPAGFDTNLLPAAGVVLTLTPGEDIDLGNGAGVATDITLDPNNLSVDLNLAAVEDNQEEGQETATIQIALANAALAGIISLPTTSLDVTISDAATSGGTTTDSGTTISPALIQNPGDVFTVQGTPGEEVVVDFGLSSVDLDDVSELGFFIVDDVSGSIDGILPGEDGYQEAALRRAESIFSVLPDTEDLLGNTNLLRELSFPAGTHLGLYLTTDGTAAEALSALANGQTANVLFGTPSLNANATDYLEATGLDDGSFTWMWQGDGNQDFGSLSLTAQATTKQSVSIGTQLQEATNQELIDLTAQAGQTVNATFTTSSDATFDNSMGLYVVENQEGTIFDQLTGATLNPGDEGYAEAAVRQTVLSIGGDSSGSQQLQGGFIYATYLIADGDMTEFLDSQGDNSSSAPMAYFVFGSANTDGFDHINMLGNNTWGMEDVQGGGDKDYNDFVVRFDLSVV